MQDKAKTQPDQDRRAAALRENLRKRKVQAEQRASAENKAQNQDKE